MIPIEKGKTYYNNGHSREITKIDGGEIYYKTEKGKEAGCWITTFEDWVKKGEKQSYPPEVKYQVAYVKNGIDYIIPNSIKNIDTAKTMANDYKSKKGISNVRLIEFTIIKKVIEV